MKIKTLILIFTMFSLVACSDSEEALKEQTGIQTKEEINAQNQNLQEWAQKLEVDLDKRRSFITAVEGEFEGSFSVKETAYMIRLLITPTIPDYDVDRTRTLAELEYELQNLNLNIQIMQWNPNSQLSAVGCVLQNIKPDLKKGIMNLISEGCTNTYQLFLSDEPNDGDDFTDEDILIQSRDLANQIKDGVINYVQDFKGKLRSSTNAMIYNFSLTRI